MRMYFRVEAPLLKLRGWLWANGRQWNVIMQANHVVPPT